MTINNLKNEIRKFHDIPNSDEGKAKLYLALLVTRYSNDLVVNKLKPFAKAKTTNVEQYLSYCLAKERAIIYSDRIKVYREYLFYFYEVKEGKRINWLREWVYANLPDLKAVLDEVKDLAVSLQV